MDYVIQVIAEAGVELDPNSFRQDGRFLMDMDFDANDGKGRLTLTAERHRAKGFASPKDAFLYWTTHSTAHPKRSDGNDNKPFTAYSVHIMKRYEGVN